MKRLLSARTRIQKVKAIKALMSFKFQLTKPKKKNQWISTSTPNSTLHWTKTTRNPLYLHKSNTFTHTHTHTHVKAQNVIPIRFLTNRNRSSIELNEEEEEKERNELGKKRDRHDRRERRRENPKEEKRRERERVLPDEKSKPLFLCFGSLLISFLLYKLSHCVYGLIWSYFAPKIIGQIHRWRNGPSPNPTRY